MNLHEEKPPFWGTWGRIYAALGVYLAVVIVLFTWFTWSWNQ
ncbi:MAG: hypothetical protein KatS3mg005_4096 [Bryobacteraceae bacterium]|jgi:hypothetical protein|nr:MAG: hypothetical protein KatS3mg005_4096 [Bryobacteraceae bacterium]